MKAAHFRRNPCRNPRQTQKRILEAALKEFAAQGFAGARVDAIARRARINKRMLYHYFGDKKGLFREVLRRKLAERAASLASAPEDPTEYLPYWFRIACRDREWVRLLEWEALQWGERRVIDEKRRQANAAKAIDRLQYRQAKGLLPRKLNPRQLLLAMIGLTTYPVAFPQMARLITGLSVSDSTFQTQREEFLREFAAAFRPEPAKSAPRISPSSPHNQKVVAK
jgi:AcrR family transcriptional regulator